METKTEIVAQRIATCSCEQLKIFCRGDPIRAAICHCHACQKRTGSVYGVQARFHGEQVRMEGERSEYTRTGWVCYSDEMFKDLFNP